MEPEISPVVQEDNEKNDNHVETRIGAENMAEKLNENNVVIDVMSYEVGQATVVVQEPIVPDITLFSYEVQQGYRIFRELLSDNYKSITYPFIQPVDVDGLNLWDYHARIETPMSFNQIESKFRSYSYESITAVISDIRLILENCYRYNGSSHWVSKLAHKLEKVLDQKLALLNRSLREKVTLRATMAFRNKRGVVDDVVEDLESGGRPRRSGRTSYGANGINAEERSSLMTHLLMEEEENQREMKRLKEKEKKEANEALMQELDKWEKEIFTKDVLNELKSMWEIPSIGSFLWLFQSALNLPELNYTEFERGLVLPHKSQQMAWIFTSLLVTPNQRKSIHKKSPMKFSVWERKLKERLDIWYLAKQDEELQMIARQIGLNPTFFEVLGESNPLETSSYIDLTLHQRVLVLKVLCEECLDYHPELRDVLGNTDATPYSETYLGYDANSSTYLYFPIFDATDIRIYKQSELPALNEWYRKWTSSSRAFKTTSLKTPKRTSQSKSRRFSSSKSSKKSKSVDTSIEPGFELVCNDVESLRALCEKFAEHPPTPSRRKSGGRPTRKRCEKDLHQVLCGLMEDLARNDARYSRAKVKGMLNLMKDWKSSVEPDSGEEFIANNDETGDTAEGNLHTPLEDHITDTAEQTNIEEIPEEEGAPLLSMVTRSRKRKLLDYDSVSASSSPVSEISKNFEACDDNPDLGIEITAKKRPYLDNDAVEDPVSGSKDFCDVIVRDVVYDVVRAVVDDVICDIVDDAISKVPVSESADVALNGVDNNEHVGTSVTPSGNEGHDDDTVGVNGDEIKDQTEDHIRISADNKERLMETGSKNGEDNSDTAMDINGVECRQNHGTLVDKIPNDMTNGSKHVEQNGDANDVDTEHIIPQNKVQNHLGTNGVKTGVDGTAVYNDGQCCETKNVCNGNLPNDNNGSKTLSEKGLTISVGIESPGVILRETKPGE